MAEIHTGQKLIYLSLRGIFVGDSASLRKKKAIKKILEQHKKQPQVHALIQKGYSIDKIANIAQILLQEQVFESTTKAKARFPEIFEESVTPAVVPKMSQIEVTASNAAAPESVIPKMTDINEKNDTDKSSIQKTDINTRSQTPRENPVLTTSPDSASLPFWYQHRIMVQVQTTLEKACFNFALRNLDDVVQENKWDCAEAIELNRWPKILLEHQDKLNQNAPEDMGKNLTDLLVSINQIRHAAVHRLRLPARSALGLITDAESLAKLLQDDANLEIISTLCQHISIAIEDLEENKRSLELRLGEIKKEYAEKRIQLARQEAALIESAKNQSIENDFFANVDPDDTLGGLISAQARWKQSARVSLSTEETRGSVKTHEPGLGTEEVYDPIISAEEISERSRSCVSLVEFEPMLDEESDGLVKDLNDDSYDNAALSTTACETDGDHPERPNAVAMFDQVESFLQEYTTDGRLKLDTSLHSPSMSECEYWATPWGSRSPIEEAPVMNDFKDSVAAFE